MNENQAASNSQNTSSQASSQQQSNCCEFFIDTLNNQASAITRQFLLVNANFDSLVSVNASQPPDQITKQLVVNDQFTFNDVEAFLTYCQVWQQK
jgi:hypothetical protein